MARFEGNENDTEEIGDDSPIVVDFVREKKLGIMGGQHVDLLGGR
jgi:hypothetical protein